jgi:4'-phosphopantetheinyl transferase
VYAVTGVHPAGQRYGRTEEGKPLLLYPEGWHVSLSHSRGREVAAVSRRPIGVDIERVRPVCPALARRIFTPEEWLAIESSADPALEYTRLWTRRESFCKCTGEGMRGLMASSGKRLPDGYVWRNGVKSGYVTAVCAQKSKNID